MKKMKFLLTTIACIISCLATSQGTWEAISPTPTHQSLYDVHFETPDLGWAVGGGGTILQTTDGGANWTKQYENPSIFMSSVAFINENKGWVVGSSKIFYTNDGGVTWDYYHMGQFVQFTSVFFLNNNIGWAAGSYERVYKTTDGGENWICVESGGYEGPWFENIHFINEQKGIAVGHKADTDMTGYIAVSEDGGDTWVDVSPTGVHNVVKCQLVSENIVYALTSNGRILKSTDAGYNWSIIANFSDFSGDLFFFDENKGYVLTSWRLFETSDGGNNWRTVNSQYLHSLHAFTCIDSAIYYVGYAGDLLKSTYPHTSWQNLSSKTGVHFYKISYKDTLLAFAMGFDRSEARIRLFKTNNGGKSWNKINTVSSQSIISFVAPSNENIYAIANGKLFCRSTDGGMNWQLYTFDTQSNPSNISFYNDDIGYVGCSGGTFFKTTDGGTNWDEMHSGFNQTIKDFQCLSPLNIWARNGNESILHSTDGGLSWDEITFDLDAVSLQFINEQIGFVYSNHENYGTLYRTKDGGINWEGVFNYYTLGSLRKMAFGSEDYGWMLVGPNYYTIDKGKTWTESSDNNIAHILKNDIDFIDEKHGWICGAHNLILKYSENEISIENSELINKTVLFPNPAKDKLFLETSLPIDPYSTISIYNIHGLKLRSIPISNGTSKICIDIGFLKHGAYFLQIERRNNFESIKFIKE